MVIPADDIIIAELRELRKQKRSIEVRMRELARALSLTRSPVHCQRCGFDWIPYDPINPPITCARCGTSAWNKPPTESSRKPSDPPARSWRNRKRKRRQWEPNPYAGPEMAPAPPPRSAGIEELPGRVATSPPPYIPPAIRAAIPPPPPPPAPGALSLSQRFSRIRDEQILAEPQPETVAASAAPRAVPAVISFPEAGPEPDDAEKESAQKLVDTIEIQDEYHPDEEPPDGE